MVSGNKPAVGTAQRSVMTRKLTLRMLLVILLMAAVLPLLGYSVVQSILAKNAAVKQTSANLQFAAVLVAAHQEQVARSTEQLLVSVSEALRQSLAVGDDCDAYFQRLGGRLPEYASLALADPTGRVVCSSMADRSKPSVADRLYFQNALKTGELAVGSYTLGRIGGQPTVQFALAVTKTDGTSLGVVIASLSLSAIADRLSKISVPPGGRLQITDPTGIVLVVNPPRPQMIGRQMVSPVLRAAIQAKSMGVVEGSDGLGATRFYAFQPFGDPRTAPFFVSASLDRDVVLGPIWRSLTQDVLVLLTVTLLSGVLLWMLGGRRLLRSMSYIVEATKKVQGGARDVRIPVQPQLTVELSNIATGFNLMADAMDKRGYQLEKELARSRQALAILDLTVNNMKEGLIAVDTDGGVSLFNQAASQLFVMDNVPSVLSGGWSRHHGLYVPGTEQLYPDDKLPLVQALSNKSGSSQHVWLRNTAHPQGRLVSCSFRPMLDEIGLYGETVVVGALMVFSDITQLQKMQLEQAKSVLELTETKRRLVDAQRAARIGSWEIDITTDRLVWSETALELMGLTQDAFDRDVDALGSIVHPDDKNLYNKQQLATWKNANEPASEFRILTLGGEIRWLYQSSQVHPNEHGEPIQRSGVIQDMTDRKMAELAMAKALKDATRAQDLLMGAQRMGRMGNWLYDMDKNLIWMSDEVYTLFGIVKGDVSLRSEDLFRRVHPHARAQYIKAQTQAATANTDFAMEYQIITPAGDVRWMHEFGQASTGPEGVGRFRSGVIQDITQRKNSELTLAASFSHLTDTQRKLTQAQKLGRMGHWELDFSTQRMWWSDEVYSLFDYPVSCFDGRHETMMALVHPLDLAAFGARRNSKWEAGSECDSEFRIVTATGEIRWMHQVCQTQVDDAGQLSHQSGMLQDITVRKLAELALVESLEKLTSERAKLVEAQRTGRIANWECDALSGSFHASDEFFAICGLPLEAGTLNWPRLLALIHPDDRPVYEQALGDALRHDVVFNAKYRLVTPAGHTRWVRQNGRIERNAQGHLVRSVGVLQDITESTRDKMAIAESLDLLKSTGEMAKIGGWELDLADGRLVYSEQVRHLYELDSGLEYTLEIARSAYPPEAQQRFAEAVGAATEHGTPWDLELPLLTQKGRQIWVRTQGRAIAENGIVKRLAGTLQDITAQQASRQQLHFLQTCVARLQDTIVITDARPTNGVSVQIVYVSDAFELQTGYSREEAVGQTLHFLQGPETSRETLHAIRAALNAVQPIRVEIVNYKKSGELYWTELDISPVPDELGCLTHWVSVQRDITARKLSEQALRDSEQRYAALFASTPLPMMVLSKGDLRYLTVNEAATSIYGFSLAEFQGMTALDVRVPSERPALHALMKTELPDQLVLCSRHQRKDGSEFPTEGVIRTIHYDGKPAWFVVTQDVSARAKAEKDLQDQLMTLQRAADAAQAITAHQTLDGAMNEVAAQARMVIGAHQALVILTENSGWSSDHTICGMSLSDKYAAYRSYAEKIDGKGIYALVCETNKALRLTQTELEAHPRWQGFGKHADKHPAMRGWLAVPLRGREGQNIGLLQLSDKYEGEFTLHDEYVINEMAQLAATALENAHLFDHIRDLNAELEQKVTERTAALSRQEALFRAIADEAPQAIWTINALSEVTYVNRAFLALVGGENAQWLGKQWVTLIHPEDLPELLQIWETAIAQRASYANMRRLKGATGQWHTMSCTASPVFNDLAEVDFWVGIETDMTNIKATEAALRLSNKELEAFSYSVSHDLRSPLNTIDGFSRLLAKQVAVCANDKAQHYLSRIQAGVAQMGQLIEDLLALAQVSRTQLRIEKVDLSALSQKILDDCLICAPERVVNVRIESGLVAFGDARLLRVVMENLLGNAWKFTAHRSVAEIAVGMTPESDGDPVFFVADDGAGFDMAYADKLFTAFQRLHSVQDFPGSGIGLATVSRVIGRHGGKLWADAKVDKGARFFFTLPNMPPPLLDS